MIAFHLLFIAILGWLSTRVLWGVIHRGIGVLAAFAVPWILSELWEGCEAETRKGVRVLTMVSYVFFLFPLGGIANLIDCEICDSFAVWFPPHSVASLELALVTLATLLIIIFVFEIDEILLDHPNRLSHRIGLALGVAVLLTWALAATSILLHVPSIWVDLAVLFAEALILISIAVMLREELEDHVRVKLSCYAVIRLAGLATQLVLVGFLTLNHQDQGTEGHADTVELLLAGVSATGAFFAIALWVIIDVTVAYYRVYGESDVQSPKKLHFRGTTTGIKLL